MQENIYLQLFFATVALLISLQYYHVVKRNRVLQVVLIVGSLLRVGQCFYEIFAMYWW
jgi:hypothetical protein